MIDLTRWIRGSGFVAGRKPFDGPYFDDEILEHILDKLEEKQEARKAKEAERRARKIRRNWKKVRTFVLSGVAAITFSLIASFGWLLIDRSLHLTAPAPKHTVSAKR